MARPGFFTDNPAAGQRAVMLRQQGLTHTEIAQRLQHEMGTYISPDGVRQHLVRVGIPTELGAFDSTGLSRGRYALLSELARLGRKVDLDDLARTGTGPSRAVSLLHSMRKQGLVSFVESTSDMGHGKHHRGIIRIELTDGGRAALLRAGVADAADAMAAVPAPQPHSPTMADFDVVQQTVDDIMQAKVRHDVVQVVDEIVALVDELEADDAAPALADTPDVAQDSAALADDPRNPWAEPATPPQPEPDPWLGPPTPETQAALDSWADAQAAYGSWPVLANLRQRQARQVRLAALLREAAELADDEGLGVTLLEHADTIPGLSDIELEYLRFADAARNWPVRPDSAGGGA